MGLPNIEIIFKKLATSLVRRSQRGIACIVVFDDTKDAGVSTYTLSTEVAKTDYTVDSYKMIMDCFLAGPYKLIVVKVKSDTTFPDIAKILEGVKFNWIAVIKKELQADLVTWIKGKNKNNKSRQIKAIVHEPATAPNDKHIVNFTNSKVKRKSDVEELDGIFYLPRLAALLSALPLDRSSTFYQLEDLEHVVEPVDVNGEIDKGKFIIINDDGEPKIARGVTSLTTISETDPEDFKKIIVVETADMIQEDIYQTFKTDYVGKYKNKYDNQALLISAILAYFTALEREDVLDPNYDNMCDVNVDKQRELLIAMGKTEAASWEDYKIKLSTIGSKVILLGKIKIADAMEDMTLEIELQ